MIYKLFINIVIAYAIFNFQKLLFSLIFYLQLFCFKSIYDIFVVKHKMYTN